MQSTASPLDQHVKNQHSHASIDATTSNYNNTPHLDRTSNDASIRGKGKGKARAEPHNIDLKSSHHYDDDDEILSSPQCDLLMDDEPDDQDDHTSSSATEEVDDEESSWCLICHTSPISDRTVLPQCLHSQFCFTCILRWIHIKR
ncbi:hypothetical protein, partial [Sporisorium scitamineum]